MSSIQNRQAHGRRRDMTYGEASYAMMIGLHQRTAHARLTRGTIRALPSVLLGPDQKTLLVKTRTDAPLASNMA